MRDGRRVVIHAEMLAAVDRLSDTEAGRLLKALLVHVNGAEANPSGKESPIYWLIVSMMDNDAGNVTITNSRTVNATVTDCFTSDTQQQHNNKKSVTNNTTTVTEQQQMSQSCNNLGGEKEENPVGQNSDYIYIYPNTLSTTPLDDSTQKGEEKDNEANKYILSELRRQEAEVIDMLNAATGRRYRLGAKAASHIRARFREGYTMDDFADVIRKKCAEWMGTDMEKYLRPETLFGTKFDGYLQQPDTPTRRGKAPGSGWSFEGLQAGRSDCVTVTPECVGEGGAT